MTAVTRDRYGGPEVLRVGTLPVPSARPGEVLVRVEAASVNAADVHGLRGYPWLGRLSFGVSGPRHPGLGNDVCGVVEALGQGVTDLAVGDRVTGNTGGRGFAEFATLRSSHAAVVPDAVPSALAACLPTAGATALIAVDEHGRVGDDDRVLVNGATGGVGHLATQLAVHRGAVVTAVCSARNEGFARSLGATEVVDRHTTAYPSLGRRWDVIVDNHGTHPAAANLAVLADGGRWVLVSGPMENRVLGPLPYTLRALARARATSGRHASMFVSAETRDRLAILLDLTAAGAIRPRVERTFGLADVPAAMAHAVTGRTCGKLVIDVAA